MYDIKDGPLPEGTKTRGTYMFAEMRVGQWFFAPGAKPSTVRAAAISYRLRHAPYTMFSCHAATLKNGAEGTICKRLAWTS